MDFFADIIKANQPSGTIQGISLGIVADTNDPLKLQRIQCMDMTKGGQTLTDWLFRLLPYTQYSPPVPKPNDVVVIGYIDGNPHKGCYLGVVVNKANKPVGEDSDLTIVIGDATIRLKATGELTAIGLKSAKIEAKEDVSVKAKNIKVEAQETVEVKAAKLKIEATEELTITTAKVTIDSNNVKISGKDAATVGATDSRGDSLTTKGY